MRNLISINQGILSDIAPSITFDEAAVLDYLIGICTSDNANIEKQRIEGYTWVNYTKLLNDMPLLKGRTKITVGQKIKKLEMLGLIKTYCHRADKADKQIRKYVKMAPLSFHLFSRHGREIHKKNYAYFKKLGLNDHQAKILSSEFEFINKHQQLLTDCWPGGKHADGPSYLWASYSKWLREDGGDGVTDVYRRGETAIKPMPWDYLFLGTGK